MYGEGFVFDILTTRYCGITVRVHHGHLVHPRDDVRPDSLTVGAPGTPVFPANKTKES